MRSSWRTLAFTCTILAFGGGAVFVANSVEYGQPSGTAVAMHKTQQRPHPQSTTQLSTHIPRGSAAPTSTRPATQTPTGPAKQTPTGSASQKPTAGPIPASAVNPAFPHGINLAQVPDFIPTISDGKIVGYVPKSQFFPPSATQNDQATPLTPGTPYHGPTAAEIEKLDEQSISTVYGPDLTTIIGHMYPGQVFVPLDQTPPPYTATGGPVTVPTSPPPGPG